MPNRIIREGILTSESVNALSPLAEIFYRRVMSVVDDFGRYHANPRLLRPICYPLKVDSVTVDDIVSWISECEKVGLMEVYEVEGTRYFELSKWRQKHRNVVSKFPGKDGKFTPTGISRAVHVSDTRTPHVPHVRTYSETETESYISMGAHAPQISDGSDSLKKRNRFVPPSLDQVKEHFVTAGMKHSDAEEFFDHHAARGWKLSKGLPMVDWHRAAGTWKRNLGQFVTNNSKPKQRIPDRLPSPRIADRL